MSSFLRGFAARCGGFATHTPLWVGRGCRDICPKEQPGHPKHLPPQAPAPSPEKVYVGLILTVQAPDGVLSSTSMRIRSPGTVKASPTRTGASASGG